MQSSASTMKDSCESEELRCPSLENIMPEFIRDIGKDYLKRNPKYPINIFKTNQAIATKLLKYNPSAPTTMRTHEIFLLNRYFELPNYRGELAAAIQNHFTKLFKKDLSSVFLMKSISIETLNEMGSDYLTEHPDPSPWYALFKFDSHMQAIQLKEYKIAEPTPMALWLFLLDTYASLQHTSDIIATGIENMITNVFGIAFSDRTLTPRKIADDVREIMTKTIAVACRYDESNERVEIPKTSLSYQSSS